LFRIPVENIIGPEYFCLTAWDIMLVSSYSVIDSKGPWSAIQGAKTMETKTYTVGLSKPKLRYRVLHLVINNRAWNKEALSKPIRYKGAK